MLFGILHRSFLSRGSHHANHQWQKQYQRDGKKHNARSHCVRPGMTGRYSLMLTVSTPSQVPPLALIRPDFLPGGTCDKVF
jgi:hypothetical protein